MKSLEELNAIRDKAKGQITLRLDEEGHKAGGAYRTHVLVCGGTGCTSSGSMQIIDKLKEEIEKNNCAMSVYLPSKGESIWQIAKTLGMSIESIMQQNADLGDTMKGDERIVIYREL